MKQSRKLEDKAAVVDTSRRGSNQSGMRAYNERLVLSLIRQTGALPKAQIARRTGLSAQTVSVIMRALESDGLLQRGEPVRGKIGQPSVPMHLTKDGAFFFGLKVGRRSLDLILTDFLGQVQHRERCTHPYPTPDNTVAFARDAMSRILAQMSDKDRTKVAGLGIALPFQLWDWAETMGHEATDMQGWQDHDIGAEIETALDLPVFVCNDASTACGAELVFGDQTKPAEFLYFFVGFFIGGGLVLDNSLYIGPTGNAAALGSIRVAATDGTLCQLVDVASLAALEQALTDSGDQNAMIWDSPETWDIPTKPLDIWLNNAAFGIAQAILSSICLVDVGHVLVDGLMPTSMRAELVRRVKIKVDEMSSAGVQKPDVIEGSIGPDARALGAASLPLSKRFLVEKNSYQKGAVK